MSHLRNIIERQQEPASQFFQSAREFCEILVLKIEFVMVPVVVRWIEVKERGLPVTFPQHFLIRQAFKLHMEQTFVGVLDQLRKGLGVVVRPILHRDYKAAPPHEAAVTILLEEKEASCALDVCESLRVGFVEYFEPPSAHDTIAEIANQFVIMHLANAEEIENVFVQIVQDLNLRWFLMEEHLGTAAKRLTVAGVSGDQRNYCAGEPVLAAHVGYRSNHVIECVI